jgi:Lecithin retinol acyltransferase
MYGDVHLVSRAALGLFPYTHFGVEMQSGGICENSLLAGIRIVSLADFTRGRTIRVQNPDATPEERARAVKRAESRIGERRYSLTANNCEHFANWCATGVAVSHQVIAFMKALAQMVFAGAVSLLVVSLTRASLAE